MMKNTEKRNNMNLLKRRWFLSVFTFLAVLLLVNGCDSPGSVLTEENNTSGTEQPKGTILSPDVAFQVSYDQKTMTFNRFWPGDVVAGFAKGKELLEDGDTELLEDYELIHEELSFDEQGNLFRTYSYMEGHAEMNMPEELFQQVKEEVPAEAADYDPVVKFEFGNGIMRYIGRSGNIVNEINYDPAEFRIDPALLDSMKAEAEDNSDVDAKIRRNLAELEQSGIAFDLVGKDMVVYDIPVDNSEEVSAFKEVVDLKTGEVVRSAVVLKDGRFESTTFMDYEIVRGHPVMANSETLHFGMANGEWDVTGRTVINRSNINIIFN